MESTTLDRAVEVVRALTPGEQQQLRGLMDTWQTPQPVETSAEQQQRLAERLLAKGLLTHIPEGYPDGYVEPPPITVSGEPVSETIIRERG